MGVLSDFRVGQIIQIQDGRSAAVRFVGTTQFATGDWVGVELEDASGKNDGAVQGQRYFNCAPAHGMFLRPAAATILRDVPTQPAKKTTNQPNGAATKSRPSSVVGAQGPLRRQSVIDPVSKRASINTSPTPSGRVPARTSKVGAPNIPLSCHHLTQVSRPLSLRLCKRPRGLHRALQMPDLLLQHSLHEMARLRVGVGQVWALERQWLPQRGQERKEIHELLQLG